MMAGRGRALAVALMVVVLGGCSSSPQAKRDRYLARGKALVEKKDYRRAMLEFRNAARAMPGDAESYYQLGMAYIATNDPENGYVALKKALDLNPKHRDAQLRVAQILAMTNNPEFVKDAESRLKNLLSENSADPDVLNSLAFTQLQLGQTENAIRNYENVLAQYPGQLVSSIMLARTKLSKNDPQGAEVVLKKACADAPKSGDARRVLAEFYMEQNRLPEAETELRASLALDPKNGQTLVDLGRLQLFLKRKGEAEETFKQLRSIDGYKHLYGLFLLDEGRNDEAIAEYTRLANADRDDRASRTRLVALYRRLGRQKEAVGVLDQALKRNAKDPEALLQRGELALQAGDYGKAEVDFNEVLRLKPNAAEAHYLRGKLHEARGDRRLYRQELSESLRLNPLLEPVRLELARDLIAQNDGKAALDVLDAATASQKQSPAILAQRNWALWSMGNTAEMRGGIDQLLAKGPSVEGFLQDAMWKLRAGDRNGARVSAGQALNLAPDDVRALRVVNQSYGPQEAGVALEKVKEYAAQRPKSAGVQEYLGAVLLSGGKRAEARAAFEAAKTADPKAVSAEMSLVQMDILEKKLDDARRRLQGILAADAKNRTASEWLSDVELMRGDEQSALKELRKMVEDDPGNAIVANNLAYLLIERMNQVDEGLKYAQKAVELAPERPGFCDTLGWALYRKGMYPEAVRYLERADRSSANPVWKYHLAMAYAKAGDLTRGRATFQAAKKQNPGVPEAKDAEALLGGGK